MPECDSSSLIDSEYRFVILEHRRCDNAVEFGGPTGPSEPEPKHGAMEAAGASSDGGPQRGDPPVGNTGPGGGSGAVQEGPPRPRPRWDAHSLTPSQERHILGEQTKSGFIFVLGMLC